MNPWNIIQKLESDNSRLFKESVVAEDVDGGGEGYLSGSSDEDEEESSYFSLFDDPKDYYSDAGRDYISEYTTFFSS